MAPKLTDMSTWTGRTGHDGLRSFTDDYLLGSLAFAWLAFAILFSIDARKVILTEGLRT